MQFNVVPRTGGFAINRKNGGKEGCDGIILTHDMAIVVVVEVIRWSISDCRFPHEWTMVPGVV